MAPCPSEQFSIRKPVRALSGRLARPSVRIAAREVLVRKWLFVLALVVLMAISAEAHIPIGTLAGRVVDSRGRPVAGAAITIQTSDGLEPYATHTDRGGHFQVTRLEAGQYDLRASFEGANSAWTKRVMVHENKTTTVTVHLPAAIHKS
jgi:hypothetical protein